MFPPLASSGSREPPWLRSPRGAPARYKRRRVGGHPQSPGRGMPLHPRVWPPGPQSWGREQPPGLPTLGEARALAPELLGGELRAFGEGFELGPDDRWVADAGAEAAVGAGDNVFAAHEPSIADQALRHQR